jgi:hypothetical protein
MSESIGGRAEWGRYIHDHRCVGVCVAPARVCVWVFVFVRVCVCVCVCVGVGVCVCSCVLCRYGNGVLSRVV